MNWVVVAVLALLVVLFFSWSARQQNKVETVTTEEVINLMKTDTNVVILDVRTPEEYESSTGHLKGAILVPVQELNARMHELDKYKSKTVIAVCRSGNRSGRATAMMGAKGFKVLNMTGGMLKWNAEEKPVAYEESEK
ncbi:MAG TPA: rhodanese-like domain-containing protein [Bacteroidota bacterium]